MKKINLIENAYACGCAEMDNICYQASAKDEQGNEYLVTWEVIADMVNDESESCDWSKPYMIEDVTTGEYLDVERCEVIC